MVFNLIIPEINSRPKNTKDAIISILSLEWPLSARKIFYEIKRQYRYSHTYQSVYKSLKELVEKNVLREKDGEYEINISWIKTLQSFTDIVETNYYAQKRINEFSGLKESRHGEDMIILSFNSLFDTEKYLYYFMKTELLNKKNELICLAFNNEWRPIFYLRSEYNYYNRLKSRGHKFYFLCSGKSYLEKLSERFYNSIGVNFKIVSNQFPNDILVFSDYFIQIFIPEKLKKDIKTYLKKREILGLLKNVLEKKSSIKVIITKDKSLANEMRKNILDKFKE